MGSRFLASSFISRQALAALVLCAALPLHADPLPRPAGLEPDVGFWRRIFTDVSTTQVLVHDNRYLGIVYEKFDIPAGASDPARRRLMEQTAQKYEGILLTLATGVRDNLDPEAQRVLDLWPPGTTNDEFAEAARRVRTQQGLADRFQQGLVRSGRWEDHIRISLRDAGVPESLAALPHVESSFNPAAQSFVGAVGLWQFTAGTGKRFMQINNVVDERRDPFRSSEAAARLLRSNYGVLQSWPLAITAYNHGVGGMQRAVRTLGTDDIETIVRNYDGPAFGFASRNFYVAFLAADEVDRNAEKFFGPVRPEQPEERTLVVLPNAVGVATLTRTLGVPRDTLKAYNPALLEPVWSGRRAVPKGFALRLPADAAATASASRLADVAPEERRPPESPPAAGTHRVARGETLWVIARRYGTTSRELANLNGLSGRNLIREGQVLRLPGSAAPAATAPGSATPAASRTQSGARTYTVRPGDSLAAIAKRTGVSPGALMAINSLGNPNRIYPGQTLRLDPEGG